MNIDEFVKERSPERDEISLYSLAFDQLSSKLREEISKNDIDAEPVLVGSVAKGTNLKGSDLDIFIAFSRKYSEKEIEKTGLLLARKAVPSGKARYAEHPYITGNYLGIKTDIVPCYMIKPGEIKVSSVDRTLLHTKYVNENLSDTEKNEVRKLKLFMKAAGIYGADVMTSGFSGYICELLIINKKSFDSVIKDLSNLKGRLRIPEHADLAEFGNSTAIVIDPTDPKRNAAAAVSLESLSKFKIASKLYLNNGFNAVFNRKGRSPELNKRGTVFRLISIRRPDRTEDVLYPQAARVLKKIEKTSFETGFRTIGSLVQLTEKEIRILIEFNREVIPSVIIHEGPPVDNGKSLEFLEKWDSRPILRGPYVMGDRLYVEIESDVINLDRFLISVMEGFSLGGTLESERQSLKIINPTGLGEYKKMMKEYLSKGLFN